MNSLDFERYQARAVTTDAFGGGQHEVDEAAFLEKVLGLCGEAGEVADKVKKLIRDKQGRASEEDKQEIIKELGDVLWYNALICEYLGVSLADVAEKNLAKLEDRQQRNQISGSGDNR